MAPTPEELSYWGERGFEFNQKQNTFLKGGFTLKAWTDHKAKEAAEGETWSWDNQRYEKEAPDPEPEPEPKMDEAKSPKLAPPMVFDGDKRKAKLFLQQVKVYVEIKKDQFQSDMQRVAFALSFMQKGEAARFAETWYVATHESKELLSTWKEYEDMFMAQFYAKTTQRAAFDRLVTLKQTGGVDAYISIFRKLLTEAEVNDESILIGFFRRGLKHEIAMEINRKDTLPMTIVGYMDAALEMEARRASIYGGGQSYSKKKDPYVMDIDRVEARGEEAPAESLARQMSAGEKDRRRCLGLCFKCGNKGLSRDCPNHPKTQAWKPNTNARAATTAPTKAGPSARKIKVDESVLNQLLAMEEKFNKLTEKDF